MKNFVVKALIDGQRKIEAGPIRKDAGQEVVIYQRNGSEQMIAVRIECFAMSDGKTLKTVVKDGNGNVLSTVITNR